jgi:hypothetical protein
LICAKQIEAKLVRYVWDAAEGVGVDDSAQLKNGGAVFGEEAGQAAKQDRPVTYYHAILVVCAVCFLTIILGPGYQRIAEEIMLLYQWTSLTFLLMTLVTIFLALVSLYVSL